MGQSSSSARRRRRHATDISNSTTANNYSSSSSSFSPPPPQPPPPPPPPPPSSTSNYPYYTPNPYSYPPPNPNYYNSSSNSYLPPSYQHQLTHAANSIVTFIESLVKPTTSSGTGSRPNTNFYYNNYGPPPNRFSGPWVPSPPFPGPPPPPTAPSSLQQQQPPQFVESQNAKTVKNEVNVHKDTIRFLFDEKNDHHLLSFTFDASVDGSITIYYFAKEEEKCIFSPVYPDIYRPTKFTFQEGPGQIFCQPSGSGIDLGFFALEDLSKPVDGDTFPLVICINNKEATCAQITKAIIEKTNGGSFQAKVIKQILLVNGERYELQEIYGLGNSEGQAESNVDSDGDERGKECVICLSEPRNTAVFPCRHMCMCSDCAKALRTQSNKCPICRQPVEKLMEINVNSGN